jgi:hypothetical protein
LVGHHTARAGRVILTGGGGGVGWAPPHPHTRMGGASHIVRLS